jgi:hypothetical protein
MRRFWGNKWPMTKAAILAIFGFLALFGLAEAIRWMLS